MRPYALKWFGAIPPLGDPGTAKSTCSARRWGLVRTRLFQFARFAVYAVIIVVGLSVLFGRQATGHPAETGGRWVNGRTSQGLPVSLRISDHRVVAARVTWRAHCDDDLRVVRESIFAAGDLTHDGQRFEARNKGRHPGFRGQTGVLASRLSGEAAGGVARGSAEFHLEILQEGLTVQRCESGPIGIALDL